MWPFKKNRLPEVVEVELPPVLPLQENAPLVKEAVKQLLLLPISQWHGGRGDIGSLSDTSSKQRYRAVSNIGWNILVTWEESVNPLEDELLKNTYELFINDQLAGHYFVCEYVGGGKVIGGDVAIYELYLHIEQGLAESENNSREWRAAKEQQALPRNRKT